jgi:alpha-galactosidase
MSSPIRIGIIGAGSAQFSLNLVKDLCLTAGLAGSQVCLMDPNQERLDVVLTLAERYAAEVGIELHFETTTDRSVCLQDAGFVINTAYVKGHHHEWTMRDIAAKHGYYYDGVQLGDYYQHRLALDTAREMERVCPSAWLIQVANPVFNCTTLVTRETDIKACGLCHGFYGYRKICNVIGIDPDSVTWEAAGFNHNIWLTHFLYQGRDAYPLIDEWIRTEADNYWKTHIADSTHDSEMSRAAVHQYQMYGLFPVGDTYRRVGAGATVGCTVYRGEWWMHTNAETKKHWFGEPWGGPDTIEGRRWFGQRLEDRMRELTNIAGDATASLVEAFGSTPSREQIVPLIDGLMNDKEQRLQVNVPNRGSIGEGYAEDEVWWRDLLGDMGRTQEELESFFYENAARILGIDD